MIWRTSILNVANQKFSNINTELMLKLDSTDLNVLWRNTNYFDGIVCNSSDPGVYNDEQQQPLSVKYNP